MKFKTDAVTAALRTHLARRRQDGSQPAEVRPPPEPDPEPVVWILEPSDDQAFTEVWPNQPAGRQAYPEDTPQDPVPFYLFGIVVILYFLALMVILFG